MCVIHDSRKDEPYAGERHAVAPHFVFGSIGVRRFQPFSNLGVRLHFATGDGGVDLEYLVPEVHLPVGRFFRSEIRTPTVRKSLKAGAFRRSEPSDRVTALNGSGTFRYQCRLKLLRKGRVEFGVLSLVECISADAVTDCSRGLIVSCENGRRFSFGCLSEATGCYGVNRMSVDGVECERHIFIDAVTLGSVFVSTTDHAALQDKGLLFCSGIGTHRSRTPGKVTNFVPLILRESDNRNAALIAGGIAAVCIYCPCGFRFVNAAVGIV